MLNEKYAEIFNRMKGLINNQIQIYKWIIEQRYSLEVILVHEMNTVSKDIYFSFFYNLENKVAEQIHTSTLIEEIIEELKLNSIDQQFENLLNRELFNIPWGNLHFYEEYNLVNFKYLKDLDGDFKNLGDQHYSALRLLSDLINNSTYNEKIFVEKISTIKIFKSLQGIENNIVIIGANGSGKSRFARNLDGKIANGISIIPAQKILVYTDLDNITVNNNSIDVVRSFQKRTKMATEYDFINLLSSDLKNLITALFEEKIEKANMYYNTDMKEISILDKVIEIWGSLIKHRKIIHDGKYKLSIKTEEGVLYSFNELSDGEKSVFYYIAHVLLADKYSYIVIDEPENHLHLSICNKLWDVLESIRLDCKFIYITHNLDFAVSRNQKTIIWNKNYIPPYNWDFEIFEKDNSIPEILMLEILGSRKDVLFCEGDDRNSIDYKLYSKLFKNLNVIPVKGHEEVIKYCTSFNRNPNISSLKAYGIIDGDVWTQKEILSKREDNIFVLPFNEIENAMCQQEILRIFINLTQGSEESLNVFIQEFFKEIDKKKNEISVWYANNRFNTYLKHNLFKITTSIEELQSEVKKLLDEDMVKSYYDEMFDRITTDIKSLNYESLLKYVNAKKLLTRHLGNKFIVSDFEGRFLRLLDKEGTFLSLLEELIVNPYFPKLKQI